MSEKAKEDNENDPKKTFDKRAEERKSRFKKELEESTVSRSNLVLREFEIHNTGASLMPHNFYGCDDYWDFEEFKKNLKIKVIRLQDEELEFDMVGVEPCIPNAFRRILISEVPTMAFDKILMYNNTSIIQDEVLAHRLGLIPLKADARLFVDRQLDNKDGETCTSENMLKFQLKVRCSWNPLRASDTTNPDDLYRDHRVTSADLKWLPFGNQPSSFKPEDVGPVFNDILITKLRPGHEVDMELHAVKGTGREHAKFSPVATAYYRLLPHVELLRPIEGQDAERLQKCFSPGVIDLVEEEGTGKKVAKVKDARYDICSRNVYRHEDLADAVKLTRSRDHFIFYVESAVGLSPDLLFIESVNLMRKKCRTFLNELEKGI